MNTSLFAKTSDYVGFEDQNNGVYSLHYIDISLYILVYLTQFNERGTLFNEIRSKT